MADPISISTIAIGSMIASAAGAGVSAIGQYQSGQYQAAVARNNAISAANMARYDAAAGAAKAQDEDMRGRATIGKALAGEAASGLDANSGTPAKVVSSDSEIARLNTLRTADNARLQSISDMTKSKDYETEGKLAAMKGDYGAASSLISGAASLGDKWSSFQQKGLLVA